MQVLISKAYKRAPVWGKRTKACSNRNMVNTYWEIFPISQRMGAAEKPFYMLITLTHSMKN